jgi:hypothetical protein
MQDASGRKGELEFTRWDDGFSLVLGASLSIMRGCGWCAVRRLLFYFQGSVATVPASLLLSSDAFFLPLNRLAGLADSECTLQLNIMSL